jgi:hypothetical protein
MESLPRSVSQADGSAVVILVSGAGTTAEPSAWEKCASPTTPSLTPSSNAVLTDDFAPRD